MRLCLSCSEAVGGEFTTGMMPENLAKSGGLKKNYGSFNVQKSRRPVHRIPYCGRRSQNGG